MRQTKKVIASRAAFKASEGPDSLNLDTAKRAILIGRKPGSSSACGLIGKAAEQTAGSGNILDYGVWLDLSFPHVIGVFGTRGTGKSFTLGTLIECLAGFPEVTEGEMRSAATVILDVQNQFWTLAGAPSPDLPEDRQHLADLQSWGLSAAAVGSESLELWTPCQADVNLPQSRAFKISPGYLNIDDWLALLEQERFSPMGQALVELLRSSTDHSPGALAQRAIPGNLGVQATTVDALRWRLQAVADMDLIGEPSVDIAELLKPGRTSVMLLRNIREDMRALVAGVVARLLAVRMSEYHQASRIARRQGGSPPVSDMPERLWLAIDEAHVIVPNEGKTPASDPFVDYVKRGRDAGLSLIFATQQPSAVDSKLMSQVDITLMHGLGFDADIRAAIQRMSADDSHTYSREGRQLGSTGSVIRALRPGEAIVADLESGRIFIQKVRPRLTAHGGNTPESAGEAQ